MMRPAVPYAVRSFAYRNDTGKVAYNPLLNKSTGEARAAPGRSDSKRRMASKAFLIKESLGFTAVPLGQNITGIWPGCHAEIKSPLKRGTIKKFFKMAPPFRKGGCGGILSTGIKLD